MHLHLILREPLELRSAEDRGTDLRGHLHQEEALLLRVLRRLVAARAGATEHLRQIAIINLRVPTAEVFGNSTLHFTNLNLLFSKRNIQFSLLRRGPTV